MTRGTSTSGHGSDRMFSPRRLTAFGRRDRGGVVPRVGSANCVAARPVDLIEAHFKAAHAASFILSIATPELCAPRTLIIRLAWSRVNDQHRSHHSDDDKNPHFILRCFHVCSTRDIRRRHYVLAPCNHHFRAHMRGWSCAIICGYQVDEKGGRCAPSHRNALALDGNHCRLGTFKRDVAAATAWRARKARSNWAGSADWESRRCCRLSRGFRLRTFRNCACCSSRMNYRRRPKTPRTMALHNLPG